MTDVNKSLILICLVIPCGAFATEMAFPSIDGGMIDWAAHDGPVLVVNTASLCAFTNQYKDLQDVHDVYSAQGLLVVAVPSDDFNQELETAQQVQSFCELTYGIDLPIADITPVTGPQAHPFYLWVAEQANFTPRWNFNKVLVDDGQVVATWGATPAPMSRPVRAAIDAALQ